MITNYGEPATRFVAIKLTAKRKSQMIHSVVSEEKKDHLLRTYWFQFPHLIVKKCENGLMITFPKCGEQMFNQPKRKGLKRQPSSITYQHKGYTIKQINSCRWTIERDGKLVEWVFNLHLAKKWIDNNEEKKKRLSG